MGLAGCMADAESDDEDEDELAGGGAAPAFYTADMAKRFVRNPACKQEMFKLSLSPHQDNLLSTIIFITVINYLISVGIAAECSVSLCQCD